MYSDCMMCDDFVCALLFDIVAILALPSLSKAESLRYIWSVYGIRLRQSELIPYLLRRVQGKATKVHITVYCCPLCMSVSSIVLNCHCFTFAIHVAIPFSCAFLLLSHLCIFCPPLAHCASIFVFKAV